MLKPMYAKFASKCAATGAQIKKGDLIQYDTETRKAYKEGSQPKQDTEEGSMKGYIEAQEEAYLYNQGFR